MDNLNSALGAAIAESRRADVAAMTAKLIEQGVVTRKEADAPGFDPLAAARSKS